MVALLSIAPGAWVWLIRRYVAYRKAVEDLILRWRMNGKRDPEPCFFKLYSRKGLARR